MPLSDLWLSLYVFVLATFVGLEVIRRVSPLLHTPLMSLTNAISAIAIVGSIMITGQAKQTTFNTVLGAVAVFCSMTNIVSGFLITDRMLKMFKTRQQEHRKGATTWSGTSTYWPRRSSSSRSSG